MSAPRLGFEQRIPFVALGTTPAASTTICESLRKFAQTTWPPEFLATVDGFPPFLTRRELADSGQFSAAQRSLPVHVLSKDWAHEGRQQATNKQNLNITCSTSKGGSQSGDRLSIAAASNLCRTG